MKAIEVNATIDNPYELHLSSPLLGVNSKEVKLIVLFNEDAGEEIDKQEWAKQAIDNNSAFDFLKAPEEDIYTLSDGKPYDGEA
jgi:hypothetical protein